MARIPTYSKDINISDLDRFIGTDGDTNELTTKNFYLGDVAEYVIDKFIDPDAESFTIPVFRDTSDTLGANATRITGSIISQNSIQGTNISIAGSLDVKSQVFIRGGSSPSALILSTEDAQEIVSIEAPSVQDIVQGGYRLILPKGPGQNHQQLTTDGQGRLYWSNAEDDDLTIRGDYGEGTIDLDSQKLTIKGKNGIITEMQDQTLTVSGKGVIFGVGSQYNLAVFEDNDRIVNSLISQNDVGGNANKVTISASSLVVGSSVDAYQNQHVIGNNVNSAANTIIDSNTTVALGDDIGGVSSRYKNVAVLNRGLRIGKKDVIGNTTSNTTGYINFNDSSVGNQAYINYNGIVGYFPMIASGSSHASAHFFNAFSEDSALSDFGVDDHNSSARYNLKFNDFGNDSNSSGKGAVSTLETHANNNEGSVFYNIAYQNYDYNNGPQSTPGSGGIFSFDARNNYTDGCVRGGTTLFLLKSGFSNNKLKIHQVQGGSSNPAPSLEFGKNASSTGLGAIAMGTTVTASGNNSACFGASNIASGNYSSTLGQNNESQGASSFSAGQANKTIGLRSMALGYQSQAEANNSVAIGYSNISNTKNGIAIGMENHDNAGSDSPNFLIGQGNNTDHVGTEGNIILGRDNTISSSTYGDMEHNILVGRNLTGLNAANNARKDAQASSADACITIGVNNTFPSQTTYPTSIILAAGKAGGNPSQQYNAIEITEKQTSSGDPSYIIIGDGIKNLTDDAAAASAGVPIRGIYRTGSDLRIRMGSGGLPPVPNATLTPTSITATAGQNFWLTASNIGDLGKITWVGGNGTFTLKLPPAAGTTNRVIRLITDGTFGTGAGDKVLLSARTGDTIDGAASFEISKAYEGVAVWSDGSEWYIIQSKAH